MVPTRAKRIISCRKSANANDMSNKEAVGTGFDVELMRYASAQAWCGVEMMQATFKPGMRESDACAAAQRILADVGMERIWHPTHVRFGVNTTKTFKQKSDGDPVLGEDDIYFVDIGPVFRGHEGDVGATFVVGDDPEKIACAAAAKELFETVRRTWKDDGLAGPALYDFAAQRAHDMGWKLNLDIKGHRVSDYPHSVHRGGDLGDFNGRPASGVWILEIQIAHVSKPFGAFYEDLLI
jgi:Xaa-Pro aminopeptidase